MIKKSIKKKGKNYNVKPKNEKLKKKKLILVKTKIRN